MTLKMLACEQGRSSAAPDQSHRRQESRPLTREGLRISSSLRERQQSRTSNGAGAKSSTQNQNSNKAGRRARQGSALQARSWKEAYSRQKAQPKKARRERQKKFLL